MIHPFNDYSLISSRYEKVYIKSKLFHSDGHIEWDNNSLGCLSIYLDYDI